MWAAAAISVIACRAVLPSLRATEGRRCCVACTRASLRMGLLEEAKSIADGVKAAYLDETYVPDGFVRARHILFLADADADASALV